MSELVAALLSFAGSPLGQILEFLAILLAGAALWRWGQEFTNDDYPGRDYDHD